MALPPGATKRQKELARKEHQRDKAERKKIRNQEKKDGGGRGAGGEDPDIAGIVPGPQPISEDGNV